MSLIECRDLLLRASNTDPIDPLLLLERESWNASITSPRAGRIHSEGTSGRPSPLRDSVSSVDNHKSYGSPQGHQTTCAICTKTRGLSSLTLAPSVVLGPVSQQQPHDPIVPSVGSRGQVYSPLETVNGCNLHSHIYKLSYSCMNILLSC